MKLAEKLKKLRLQQGLTQKQIAEKLGITQRYYAKWETSIRFPNKQNIIKLAKMFDISTDYFLDEEDTIESSELLSINKKLSPKNQNKILEIAKKLENEDEDGRYPYDVLNQRLSAGCWECYSDELDYTRVYWKNDIAYDYAVWIKGDSMEPLFHDYEVALIKKQPVIDYQGQVCAVDDIENGDAYIKCVYVEEEGYRLVSINQTLDEKGKLKYPDFILPFKESPRIIGRVVAHFKPDDD